ncbi:MAG: hypothetical protein ACREEM_39905 [Blastocatellia bacterium]
MQTSPVHTGYCKNPTAALERLLDTMVRATRTESSDPS